MVAGFYGSRRSAIELPGDVNDSSCHEKVDYSCFSALCSGDGAGFLRERFRRWSYASSRWHNDAIPRSSASAPIPHHWNVTDNLPLGEICTPLLSGWVAGRPASRQAPGCAGNRRQHL